ncbi:MAG: hypothetical protein M3Y41_08810 [Pseudomonadota bacterium]|nr:hypothetical protein [Pseudomonadota bacterium]
MHDGTVLKTWGVQVGASGQWVGKVHPIGPTGKNQAEAHANGGLFAASKLMAELLTEATQAWSSQFDGPEDEDRSVSGADLVDWFAQWRLRARTALDAAGVPCARRSR